MGSLRGTDSSVVHDGLRLTAWKHRMVRNLVAQYSPSLEHLHNTYTGARYISDYQACSTTYTGLQGEDHKIEMDGRRMPSSLHPPAPRQRLIV